MQCCVWVQAVQAAPNNQNPAQVAQGGATLEPVCRTITPRGPQPCGRRQRSGESDRQSLAGVRWSGAVRRLPHLLLLLWLGRGAGDRLNRLHCSAIGWLAGWLHNARPTVAVVEPDNLQQKPPEERGPAANSSRQHCSESSARCW